MQQSNSLGASWGAFLKVRGPQIIQGFLPHVPSANPIDWKLFLDLVYRVFQWRSLQPNCAALHPLVNKPD